MLSETVSDENSSISANCWEERNVKAIGIDIGTTTVCGVVMDLENRQVLEAKTLSNDSFLRSEDWEKIQDAQRLVDKAGGLANELLEKYPDVSAIGLTGQMHGIVYLDEEGKAVSPLYTWEDSSGDQKLPDGLSVVKRLKKYGRIPAATGYGCITYLYHVSTGKVPEKAVTFCTIMDYLGMVLTGRRTPLVHVSNAAGLGLFLPETLTFLTDVLEKEGGKASFLPEVTKEVAVLGTCRGVPVTAALGDHQAAFLGSIGFEENVWSVNVGTSGQISVLSKEYFSTPGIDVRPYLNGCYLLTGAALCGGRSYAILEKFFRAYAKEAGYDDGPQYDVLSKLAQKADENSGGLSVETTFSGTREDPGKLGCILNISEANFTPANMVRGFLQGIVNELYAFHQRICEETGIGDVRLIASGNACRRNPELRRLFSETFGAEIVQAVFTEEAASGAAISTVYRG